MALKVKFISQLVSFMNVSYVLVALTDLLNSVEPY